MIGLALLVVGALLVVCGCGLFFVRFGLFTAFFVESLILAQDERWRRA